MIQILSFIRDRYGDWPVSPRKDVGIKVVIFEASNLEDLLLIAKYKIVDFPVSIVIDGNDNVLLRIRGLVSSDVLDNLVK